MCLRDSLYLVLFGEILLAEQWWNRFNILSTLDIFLSEITFYVSPCRDCFQPVCAWTVYFSSLIQFMRVFQMSLRTSFSTFNTAKQVALDARTLMMTADD